MSPVEIAFWRWMFTFLAMLPFGIAASLRCLPLLKRNWKWMVPAGVLGFSTYSILMFEAGRTTDTTNLSLIAATAPVFMAFFAVVFQKERLSRSQIAGLATAVTGVLVLEGDFHRLLDLSFTIGDLWMLLAASLFAVYSILVRKRPANMPQTAFMTVMLGYGFVTLCPLMALEAMSSTYHMPDGTAFWIILYIAVIPTLTGYLLWNRSVDIIGASRAGIVYYSIPLFSSIEAVIFLHETVRFPQIAGGFLIIGGILLSSMNVLRQMLRH